MLQPISGFLLPAMKPLGRKLDQAAQVPLASFRTPPWFTSRCMKVALTNVCALGPMVAVHGKPCLHRDQPKPPPTLPSMSERIRRPLPSRPAPPPPTASTSTACCQERSTTPPDLVRHLRSLVLGCRVSPVVRSPRHRSPRLARWPWRYKLLPLQRRQLRRYIWVDILHPGCWQPSHCPASGFWCRSSAPVPAASVC